MENRTSEESLDHRTDALEKREHQLSSLRASLTAPRDDLDFLLLSAVSEELERIAALAK